MPRLKGFNEEVVLEKAMFVFWEQGYSKTSMQDLVSNLGINRASMYGTFGDKHELFKRSLEFYISKGKQEWKSILEQEGSAFEILKNLFESLVERDLHDSSSKGCLVANTAVELAPHDSEVHAALIKYNSFVIQNFKSILERGVSEGEIPKDKDLDSAAHFLYTVILGFRVLGKTKPSRDESIASLEFALTALK